jgi:molybdenum cofactor cytidylyltransferase
MEFGPVPPAHAVGAILAHSLALPGGPLRKGLRIGEAHVRALREAGVEAVTVARPGPDDVEEDAAAAALAAALVPDPEGAGIAVGRAATGQVNLHALGPGLVEIDAGAVHSLNAVDPAITFASLPPWTRVGPRTLLGTVKIIAYAVPRDALEVACDAARGSVRVRPPRLRTASLILSEVPGAPQDPDGKGPRAVAARIEALGGRVVETVVAAHETAALEAAMRAARGEVVLVLTASATSDVRDVAPAAVVAAGGRVERFGMPVDPGNLLFLASLGERPIVGLPGCARSPALNGADWVMERVVCGVPVTSGDIAAMGVGGLLKEVPQRGRPREP